MARIVRVAILGMTFLDDADIIGSDEVRLRVRIGGRDVGDLNQRFEMVAGTYVVTDMAVWGADFDYAQTGQVELTAEVEDDEATSWESMGRVRLLLRWPFAPRSYTLRASSGKFTLLIAVDHRVEGADGDPNWGATFVPRREVGGTTLATVTPPPAIRIEVHDCLPVPSGAGTPNRPAFGAGIVAETDDAQSPVSTTGPNNVFFNPAVIPILPTGTARSTENCANFKVTYICDPAARSSRRSMPELRWEVRSLGGQATIFGSSTGRTVKVHGTRRGEVLVQLFHNETIAAVIRALVEPLVYIPCRAVILSTAATATVPSVGNTVAASEVLNQLNCANRFLWQLGVLLRLDTDTSIGWLPADVLAANVHATGTTGVFTATVGAAHISNVADESDTSAINSRPYVMNFAFIESLTPPPSTGGACFYSGNPTSQTDDGPPSTSWTTPSGVPPDGTAGTVTMRCGAHGFTSPAPHRYSMCITQVGANRPARMVGQTIAHEVGHCLGLRHRGLESDGSQPAAYDGLPHPPMVNVMYFAAYEQAMDFDMIQAKAVRRSSLVTHAS